MSSQPTRRVLEFQMPTFMSVYGDNSHNQAPLGYSDSNSANTSESSKPFTGPGGAFVSRSPIDSYSAFHNVASSASTSNSDDSSESSPTTTVSTLDSSSMTDPSPLVSPESPAVHQNLPASPDSLRLRKAATENVALPHSGEQAFAELSRPGLAGRKARNLKNLAVNTSQAYSLGKAVSTAQFPLAKQSVNGGLQEPTSAPTSPSFIKPPSPPKRKPTTLGLTIMTPSKPTNLPTLAIPATPSFKRPHLRHFQSSPSLPLVTPSLPPAGGMRLPTLATKPQPHGFAEVPMEDDEEPEPNFDIPQSREEKPEAYPDGPIRIYESGVDLFLEPSAEIASRYDVVMNVASEVKNPFTSKSSGSSPTPASSELASLVGVLKDGSERRSSSPTTPKATPLVSASSESVGPIEQVGNRPEYIHIPWEHNTDIVPDLHKLVRVIDERVQQGKNVLVHCQCGVSRSASLIVAYGLYKNQDLSVQEAYDAVKKRSKWIGPNMNLIMQLQEFKAGLQRNNQPMFGFSRNLPSSINAGSGMSSPDMPHTAPLQADTSPQRASTGNIPLSAGPRKPSQRDFFDPTYRRSWGAGHAVFDVSPSLPLTPYVDPSGHVVPILDAHTSDTQPPVPPVPSVPHLEALEKSKYLAREQHHFVEPPRTIASRKSVPNFSRQLPLRADEEDHIMSEPSAEASLMSPRATQFAMTSIHQPKAEDTFNLFSPMAASFQTDASHAPERPSFTQQAPASFSIQATIAPKSDDFAVSPTGDSQSTAGASFGLFSPVQSSFPRSLPTASAPAPPRQDSVQSPPEMDMMGGLASPRSEIFGMTGFSRQEANDGFGILSPMQTSFNQMPWDALNRTPNAIAPALERERSQTPQAHHYERRPSTPPTLTDASSPERELSPSPPPIRHLDASPQPGLRSKFSSPNLAEQRRLQQLQTEIESQLPHHSPELGHDEDALMSPRAEKFTNNPFHFEVPAELEPKQYTVQEHALPPLQVQVQVQPPTADPKTATVDPRSPAQTGINPITRNIFDVL